MTVQTTNPQAAVLIDAGNPDVDIDLVCQHATQEGGQVQAGSIIYFSCTTDAPLLFRVFYSDDDGTTFVERGIDEPIRENVTFVKTIRTCASQVRLRLHRDGVDANVDNRYAAVRPWT